MLGKKHCILFAGDFRPFQPPRSPPVIRSPTPDSEDEMIIKHLTEQIPNYGAVIIQAPRQRIIYETCFGRLRRGVRENGMILAFLMFGWFVVLTMIYFRSLDE